MLPVRYHNGLRDRAMHPASLWRGCAYDGRIWDRHEGRIPGPCRTAPTHKTDTSPTSLTALLFALRNQIAGCAVVAFFLASSCCPLSVLIPLDFSLAALYRQHCGTPSLIANYSSQS